MEDKPRKYSISLNYGSAVDDLGLLGAELRKISLFAPTEPIKGGINLIMETTSGSDILFKPHSVTFQYKGPLGWDYLRDSIRESIRIAKVLETVRIGEKPLGFNPNRLSSDIGNFDSEEVFQREFGLTAQELQRRLYGGGSVAYYQSSMDFNVYFGTEQAISELVIKTQGSLGTKKLEFEGQTQPASSLDDLLARLE